MRMFHKFLLTVFAIGISATPTLAQQGKDTGNGFCPLHKLNYKAANCPKCAESTGSPASGGNSSAPQQPAGLSQAEVAAQREAKERERQQEETDRIERERVVAENLKKQKDAEFIRDRDAAARTLKGSSGSTISQLKGLSATDNSSLKGSGFDTGSQVKSAPTLPSGDPKVVDARDVPSGLPKGLDSAIVGAYADAPPGVSDRVRKGFQAIMERDWKVAKAWFQDALNRDPGNAGLKRLVALADSPLQTKQPSATTNPPPTQTKPTSALPTNLKLQLPDPDDIYIMFPGLKQADENELMDILFGLDARQFSSKSGITK